MKALSLPLILLVALGWAAPAWRWSPTGYRPSSLAIATEPNPPKTSTQRESVPLFNNLGNYHHPISSRNSLAQRYFDQGLTLAYGFNHAAAARSFQAAADLDPNCAICYWGVAYVLGPNINAPMADEVVPQAWEALQRAIALSPQANAKERAYIQALTKRYAPQPVADRGPLDRAYAAAMGELARRYPEDLDAATLYAEALMDTTPWDYWQADGTPKPEGQEIMAVLESVLARDPDHPGANHFYIHTVEKERPELAIAAADRLLHLVPGAGHLVHMPSHIYIRVGRYQDAVKANQQAIAADRAYAPHDQAPGMYALGYMPHNHHFLWFGALMSGQSALAIAAAHHTAHVEPQLLRDPNFGPLLQHYSTVPLFTLVQFGRWQQILATPAPDPALKYPTAVWHYARGLAFVGQDQPHRAAQELAQLRRLAADPDFKDLKVSGFNTATHLLEIATQVLAGELAAAQGNFDPAIAHLQTAVQREDELVYTEPADWSEPVRRRLGAVLLQAGRPAEAEAVYRQDLQTYPENGWSLLGLAQSLQAQGKRQEAQAVAQQFRQAWQHADIALTASRF